MVDLGGVGYLLVFLVCRDFGSLRKVHLGPPVPLVAGASSEELAALALTQGIGARRRVSNLTLLREQVRVRDTYTRARGHPESVPLLWKTEAPS